MGRRVAAQPEVAGRGDQSLAEVPQPDAVDQAPGRSADSGRRRSPRASSSRPLPFLERRPVAARRARLRNRRGTAVPGRPGLPRRKTCGSTGCGASLSTIARAGARRMRRVELLDRAVQLLEPAALGLDRGMNRIASVDRPRALRRRRRAPAAATPSRARAEPRRGRRLRRVLLPARFELGEQRRIPRRRPRPCSTGGLPSTTWATSG